MRPIGSVVFGHLGDRYGHKAALTTSVMLMAVPAFLLGVLPTYESIGIAAPLLLVLMRMAQGASVGGEYTTSIAFLSPALYLSAVSVISLLVALTIPETAGATLRSAGEEQAERTGPSD